MEKQLGLSLGDAVDAVDAASTKETPYQVLPADGDTQYFGPIYKEQEASSLLAYFLDEIPWKHDEALIYGKHYVTDRKVAWFGNQNYAYKYSGKTRVAIIWTQQLLEIKKKVEQISGATYNACLLNLYENGSQGMGWHHDDEKGLGKNANIASLSFGAERRFDLRHNLSKQKVSLNLASGSLLVMAGSTQSNWRHQLPKTAKVIEPRVNLTFRRMLHS